MEPMNNHRLDRQAEKKKEGLIWEAEPTEVAGGAGPSASPLGEPAGEGMSPPPGIEEHEGSESGQYTGEEGEPRSRIQNTIEQFPQFESVIGDGEDKEEKIQALSDLSDPASSPEKIIEAANKLNLSGKKVIEILEASGHDTPKIEAMRGRLGEMPPEEEPLQADDVEGQTFVDEGQEALGEAKAALFSDDPVVKEVARGKIASWMDRNPGALNRGNKLVIKPLISALLIMAIIYITLLSAATKGATTKFGK
jgi:hypothetical protein